MMDSSELEDFCRMVNAIASRKNMTIDQILEAAKILTMQKQNDLISFRIPSTIVINDEFKLSPNFKKSVGTANQSKEKAD